MYNINMRVFCINIAGSKASVPNAMISALKIPSNYLFVLVIVWTRVQLTINSRVVSTKTFKLSESVGRGTI